MKNIMRATLVLMHLGTLSTMTATDSYCKPNGIECNWSVQNDTDDEVKFSIYTLDGAYETISVPKKSSRTLRIGGIGANRINQIQVSRYEGNTIYSDGVYDSQATIDRHRVVAKAKEYIHIHPDITLMKSFKIQKPGFASMFAKKNYTIKGIHKDNGAEIKLNGK